MVIAYNEKANLQGSKKLHRKLKRPPKNKVADKCTKSRTMALEKQIKKQQLLIKKLESDIAEIKEEQFKTCTVTEWFKEHLQHLSDELQVCDIIDGYKSDKVRTRRYFRPQGSSPYRKNLEVSSPNHIHEDHKDPQCDVNTFLKISTKEQVEIYPESIPSDLIGSAISDVTCPGCEEVDTFTGAAPSTIVPKGKQNFLVERSNELSSPWTNQPSQEFAVDQSDINQCQSEEASSDMDQPEKRTSNPTYSLYNWTISRLGLS